MHRLTDRSNSLLSMNLQELEAQRVVLVQQRETVSRQLEEIHARLSQAEVAAQQAEQRIDWAIKDFLAAQKAFIQAMPPLNAARPMAAGGSRWPRLWVRHQPPVATSDDDDPEAAQQRQALADTLEAARQLAVEVERRNQPWIGRYHDLQLRQQQLQAALESLDDQLRQIDGRRAYIQEITTPIPVIRSQNWFARFGG